MKIIKSKLHFELLINHIEGNEEVDSGVDSFHHHPRRRSRRGRGRRRRSAKFPNPARRVFASLSASVIIITARRTQSPRTHDPALCNAATAVHCTAATTTTTTIIRSDTTTITAAATEHRRRWPNVLERACV